MKWCKNSKGFTGIELIIIIAIGVIGAYYAAPSVGKAVHNVFEGDKNKQKMVHEVSEQYPMFYKNEKGDFVPAKTPYKRTEKSLNYTHIQPPETLWEKFWKMGAMAVIAIVVLSYLGLWPIITLWWKKKVKPKIIEAQEKLEEVEIEKDALSKDAKLIVKGVDEGLAQFNSAIEVAKASVAAAQAQITAASAIIDVQAKAATLAAAQANREIAQAVLTSVSNLKDSFMIAMSRKQNNTTKKLVEALKND